jgi:hypothetical protein
MVARLGSLVAHGRVPSLMAEFLPLGRLVAMETGAAAHFVSGRGR